MPGVMSTSLLYAQHRAVAKGVGFLRQRPPVLVGRLLRKMVPCFANVRREKGGFIYLVRVERGDESAQLAQSVAAGVLWFPWSFRQSTLYWPRVLGTKRYRPCPQEKVFHPSSSPFERQPITVRRRALPRARGRRALVFPSYGHRFVLRVRVSAGDAVRCAADAKLIGRRTLWSDPRTA